MVGTAAGSAKSAHPLWVWRASADYAVRGRTTDQSLQGGIRDERARLLGLPPFPVGVRAGASLCWPVFCERRQRDASTDQPKVKDDIAKRSVSAESTEP